MVEGSSNGPTNALPALYGQRARTLGRQVLNSTPKAQKHESLNPQPNSPKTQDPKTSRKFELLHPK